MLSKAKIKFIKSLQIKKYRKQEQCFVVQGAKSVQELLQSDFEVIMLLGTASFLATNTYSPSIEVVQVTEKELESLGEFQTNDTACAVARLKENTPLTINANEMVIALDDIRDPGNLGTIIRTADWYGIQKIIASPETADFYNQKVISSTMGSFTRVQMYYTPLDSFFSSFKGKIYGAFLEGENIHTVDYSAGGILLIGNESRGINPSLEPLVTDKITIPRYGKAESLNAAIATAIICDAIKTKIA